MAKLLKSIKENYLYWGIAFLLVFIPLYPKFPLWEVPETYVHIRLEDIFVALVVGLFALKIIREKEFSFFKDPIAKLIALYLGVGLLSLLSALFITKNVVPHIAFLHFLRRVEYISLFFVSYFSLKNRKQLKLWVWLTGTATFLVIVYGLGQKFLGWPVVSTMNKEFSKGLLLQLTWWARVNSTFAGHYDLAAFLVMILALMATALVAVKSRGQKILLFFLGILSYYMLILTASRVSFVAYLAAVGFVLWFANKKFWLVPFLVFSVLGMVFSDDLGQRYAATFKIDLSFLSGRVKIASLPKETRLTPTPTSVPAAPVTSHPRKPTPTPTSTPTETPEATGAAEPVDSTALATNLSTDIRLKVEWPRALRAFAKNPLLGTGYSSISLATDNDYLRMLGETGLLGSLAFLAVFLEIGRRFFVFWQKSGEKEEKLIVLGIVGVAIGYFLNATFIDVFESSKIAFFFWILLGIGLKITDLNKEKR